MKDTILGRKVILNENGWVISDIDGKLPFCELYRKWVNCSGLYNAEYLEQRSRLGKVKWVKDKREIILELYKESIILNKLSPSDEHNKREKYLKQLILKEWNINT